MDLLESGDERVPRDLRSLPLPSWAPLLVAVLALLVAVSGGALVAADRTERAREAARPRVDLVGAGTSSTTVGGVARGRLSLLLVNRGKQRVRLAGLRLVAEGLRVTQVQPAVDRPLEAYEERLLSIGFVVPDCSRLVLPGRVVVSLSLDGQPVERRELAIVDPDLRSPGREGLTLGGCPPSARGRRAGTAADVGVRPAGGQVVRDGAGARGVLRLEVRNAGPPLQLLRLTGEVPGVAFTPRVLEEGRSIETDGLVVVRLPFVIEDCAALQPAGRLVVLVERGGAQQELGLRAVAEPEAGVGPQVSLDLLFSVCD